jgi:hypothetical protein
MKLGLGAIAKGYGVDRAALVLVQHGFHHHIVEGGGDTYVSGTKGGKPWMVGIQRPDRPGSLAAIPASDRAIVTSGGLPALLRGRRQALRPHPRPQDRLADPRGPQRPERHRPRQRRHRRRRLRDRRRRHGPRERHGIRRGPPRSRGRHHHPHRRDAGLEGPPAHPGDAEVPALASAPGRRQGSVDAPPEFFTLQRCPRLSSRRTPMVRSDGPASATCPRCSRAQARARHERADARRGPSGHHRGAHDSGAAAQRRSRAHPRARSAPAAPPPAPRRPAS